LYLAAKLEIPVICFKNNNWLHKQLKIYKCGYSIKSLKQFSNFPKRNSTKYKSYISGLKKLNKNILQIKINQRRMEEILFS